MTRKGHKPLIILTQSQMRLSDLQLPIPRMLLMIGQNLKEEKKLVERDQESEPEEDALLVTNDLDMKGRVKEDERTCQDATRLDIVWVDGIESETADVFPIEHSGGKNVTARKRGKPEKDALLDSNQDRTGSQDDRRNELPQDDIDPGLGGVRGGQEPVEDVSGAAPPGGEMPVAPPVALYSSSHSQPASQHDSLRMSSKNNTIHVSRNVTLGASAGAGTSKGGGREGGTSWDTGHTGSLCALQGWDMCCPRSWSKVEVETDPCRQEDCWT